MWSSISSNVSIATLHLLPGSLGDRNLVTWPSMGSQGKRVRSKRDEESARERERVTRAEKENKSMVQTTQRMQTRRR